MTDAPEVTPPARPVDLRMARLHLRLGSLELARAELEASAGAGALDADALLDLAEVRWRTGDVPGAGVAAQAYLGEGGGETLALVIAAEASAAAGRPTEARRLAMQALDRGEISLERVFAGIPRSGIWPIETGERPEPAGELFAIPATRPTHVAPDLELPASSVAAGAIVEPPSPARHAASASGLWDEVEGPVSRETGAMLASPSPPAGSVGLPLVGLAGTLGSAEAAASAGGSGDGRPDPAVAPTPGRPATASSPPAPAPDPSSELDAARRDLLVGHRASAATRLAVVLRLAPSLAGDVLDALGEGSSPVDGTGAALEVVRGDAYRLLGRELEARRSYAAAAATLPASGSRAP